MTPVLLLIPHQYLELWDDRHSTFRLHCQNLSYYLDRFLFTLILGFLSLLYCSGHCGGVIREVSSSYVQYRLTMPRHATCEHDVTIAPLYVILFTGP